MFPSEDGVESMPLVIVPGFLGGSGLISWDNHIKSFGEKSFAHRKIIVPSLGAVSSLHDRACELYYSLVGGTVDYGAEHGFRHDHARYGRNFSRGLYPMWSRERPLHFLGYSVGGPTIIKLQHLLQLGHFGEQTHPDMIRSVNTVCSPFRGTQLVYTLGESATSAPDVHPFSVGALLAKLVLIIAFFSPLLPPLFDVHADARSLSFRELSLLSFFRQLWKSEWAESEDAIPYDMTFKATEERERVLEGKVYPNTFYRSHASIMTRRVHPNSTYFQHAPQSFWSHSSLLYVLSIFVGTFDYRVLQPSPSFQVTRNSTGPEILGEEYWANDGVVPLFSQWHPLPCVLTECDHWSILHRKIFECSEKDPDTVCPTPALWTVVTINETNHLSLIPGFSMRKSLYQRSFWADLGRWLEAVDVLTTKSESNLNI